MPPISRPRTTALAILTLAAFFTRLTDETRADTPQARVKLAWSARNLQVGPGMDARGKRLAGSEIVGQNLTGANFDGCDLFHVTLYDCDLTGASFRDARLTGARIWDCTIKNADFTDAVLNGVKYSGLYGLSERQLKSTLSYQLKDLSHCPISAREPIGKVCVYDFRGADLTSALLWLGDFTHSDFTDAQIDGLHTRQAGLSCAQLASTRNFKRKRLSHANLGTAGKTCDFSGMRFYNVEFAGKSPESDYTDARIPDCSFSYGSLSLEQLRQTRDYKEGHLRSVYFRDIDLSGGDFSRINLTTCSFRRCDFTGASFDDAVITRAVFFHDCRGLTLDQMKSTWNYKHGRMDGIKLPEDIAKSLKAEQRDDK